MCKLHTAAEQAVSQFITFDEHCGERQARRSVKARELVKRACNPEDMGVFFERKCNDNGEFAKLSIEASDGRSRWFAVLNEAGWATCTCPDHKGKGAFCKHLRALSGVLVLQARQAAPEPVKPERCSRCGGKGSIPHYSHVEMGVCFECRGAGVSEG